MKNYELSIIIPVLNCLAYSKLMIPTIKTSRPYKLILINNGSTDGTREYFNKLKKTHNAFVIHFDENTGCASSWNYGIRQAMRLFGSNYFFIPNNDILLHPRCIDVLFEAIKAPKVALASATDMSGSVSASVEVLSFPLPQKAKFVEEPEFSCFMLKMETIDKIGFFDEKFFPAYFEDNDYHYRIRLAGLKAVKTNRALYFHYGSRTIKSDGKIRTISNLGYTANRDYYKQKWGGIPGQEIYSIPFGRKK